MTIKNRIEKLEQAQPRQGDDWVKCVLWSIAKKLADGTVTDDLSAVHILAGQFGDGLSLYRQDGESSQSLRDRAAVEIIRIHGKLDDDWNDPPIR
ncbi:MAG: hypothetical protein NTX73_01060 [Rhodobacterales bacterium]|nr:hypothetical protein [Rhodobacterales bacterium]